MFQRYMSNHAFQRITDGYTFPKDYIGKSYIFIFMWACHELSSVEDFLRGLYGYVMFLTN